MEPENITKELDEVTWRQVYSDIPNWVFKNE